MSSAESPGALSSHKRAVQEHFDTLAPEMERWRRRSRYYHEQVGRLCKFIVPRGASVLELGSGTGDLLATLGPREGVGVDLSPRMIQRARERFPQHSWLVGDAEGIRLERTFEYVVMSDLLGHLEDIARGFESARQVMRPESRLIVTANSYIWEPALKLAEFLGRRIPLKQQNWLPMDDIENLLELADLEVVRRGYRLLLPVWIPLVSEFVNRFIARLPLIRRLCLIQYVVARPRPSANTSGVRCSVVVPCRDERDNIEPTVRRMPMLGTETEVIFVDGASTDGTREKIDELIGEAAADSRIRLIRQEVPRGKGEAVRLGFDAATGDVLMILDADLSVQPEDLAKFYDALVAGKGELVIGSRLVYPMEGQAMRFLNMLGNKIFGLIFSWVLEQRITDTLCGTKVLWRADYTRIKANRPYFGDFDPFGDFDLLFGAAKLNRKILEMPVRYHERVYGRTKISRFRHGALLFRMSLIAALKLKFG